MDKERAETYLRLMAEAELRRAQALPRDPKPGPQDPGSAAACLARLGHVASALIAVGAIEAIVADAIVDDLNAALIVRHRLGQHRTPSRLAVATRRLVRSGAPLPLSASRQPLVRPGASVRVVPVGRRLPSNTDDVGEMFLTSLIRDEDQTMFFVTGHVPNWPPQQGFSRHSLGNLRADDDLGRSCHVTFTGNYGEGRTEGWLNVPAGLPAAARWLELYSDPGPARLRVDLTGPATRADVRDEPTGSDAPGERLLDSLAAGMLASMPQGGSWPGSLEETVAALEDLGILPPGSPAIGRLAELCRQAGFRSAPRLVAALQAGTIPAAELPDAWTSLVAHFRRRNRPAAKLGVAPIAVALPECDGVRFIVTGLSSQPDRASLTAIGLGLSLNHRHQPGCLCLTLWFPWWIRDNTGQWHVAAFGGYCDVYGGSTAFSLRVVPPLAQAVTELDVIVTGPSRRVRARMPVEWMAADA